MALMHIGYPNEAGRTAIASSSRPRCAFGVDIDVRRGV
jgi:hypothetical protein